MEEKHQHFQRQLYENLRKLIVPQFPAPTSPQLISVILTTTQITEEAILILFSLFHSLRHVLVDVNLRNLQRKFMSIQLRTTI